MILKLFYFMPLILAISACTNQEMTKSGFLSDYQALQKPNEDLKEATYINPAASFMAIVPSVIDSEVIGYSPHTQRQPFLTLLMPRILAYAASPLLRLDISATVSMPNSRRAWIRI